MESSNDGRRFVEDLQRGLEELRRRARLSQGALAARMGVSQSTVSKMARGRSLTGENLGLWLGALDTDLFGLAGAVAGGTDRRHDRLGRAAETLGRGAPWEAVGGRRLSQGDFEELLLLLRTMVQRAVATELRGSRDARGERGTG